MPTLRGTSKRDILRGKSVAETILGLGGNDDLYGNSGNDTARGGNGNDKLFGGPGHDKLRGEAGKDTLRGLAGNDTLTGGSGNDTLIGGTGNDTAELATSWIATNITQLNGGYQIAGPAANGTDTAIGVERFKFTNGTFTAAQILNDAPTGGTGGIHTTTVGNPLTLTSVSAFLASFSDLDAPLGDTLSIQSITGSGDVFVSNGNLVYGAFSVSVPITYTVTVVDSKGATAAAVFSLETLPNFAPTITGLTFTDSSISFVVNDPDNATVTLTGAFASILGNAEIPVGPTVTLNVSEQTSAVSGMLQVTDSHTVVDVIELYLGTASSDNVNRTQSTTDAVMYGFGGLDGLGGGTGAETFFSGSGGTNVNVTGSYGSDTLVGGDGIDEFSGGFGADTLRGGGDADVLQGGGDGDTLFGGDGDDTLDGQDGNDTLTGDAGNDTFQFSGLSGSPASSDTITDFTSVSGTAGDKVVLLNVYPFGVWSVEEVGSDTLFKFKETTSLPGFLYMTVTVSGVTGLVAGDDYVIV